MSDLARRQQKASVPSRINDRVMPSMGTAALQRGRGTEVLAIVVLYRLSPQESSAFQSLMRSLGQVPGAPIACVVYDNSPAAHELPETSFACVYHHDPLNPGLAVAYQYALERAERDGTPWLLLLDQDTIITAEYLTEALQVTRDLREKQDIGAIVPKLVQDGLVLSPHWPHGSRSLQSFDDRFGFMEPNVRVYNSGALLRVEAVRVVGGFPMNYPLDYLDHAMFARLQAQQQLIFLLHATLLHQLESKSQDVHVALNSSPRLRGTLAAEARFYRQYGSRRDRLLLLRRRAKLAFCMLRRMEFRSLAALVRCTAKVNGGDPRSAPMSK